MGQSLVAVGGKYKNCGSLYVAVGGKWKRVSGAYEAIGGKWKSAYSGVPQGTVNISLPATAAHSRLVVSATAKGTWTSLVLRTWPHTGGAASATQITAWGTAASDTTVTWAATETTFRVQPNAWHRVELVATTSGGLTVVIAYADIATAVTPTATAFAVKGPVTHVAGGISWTNPRDIDSWNTVNDSLGTSWEHTSATPYMYYSSGLTANTRYYMRTRGISSGVYSGWSAQQNFVTGPLPYTKGDYFLNANANSQTYQTGESGGQAAKWQASEGRTWWYHGNGNAWSSTRGRQKTCIYYNRDATMQNIINQINAGGTITLCQVYVHRANEDAGNAGAVAPTIGLNGTNYSSAPSNISGNQAGPGLSKGYGAWVTVPSHWGYHILMQNVVSYGWILGDTDNQNNYMALGKASPNNTGRMLIRIA